MRKPRAKNENKLNVNRGGRNSSAFSKQILLGTITDEEGGGFTTRYV